MSVPAWFWPVGNDAARAPAAALASGGIVLPSWVDGSFFQFGGTFGAVTTLTPAIYPGASSIAQGASGDISFVNYVGPLVHVLGRTVTKRAMPSGAVYTGIAVAASAPYVVTSSGALLNSTGAAVGPGLGLAPAWELAGTSTLYTLLAAQNELGVFTASTGATGTLALPAPLATPYCVAVSGSLVGVGGTAASTLVSGAGLTALAQNPANTSLLLGVKNGTAIIWLSPGTNLWPVSTSLSGIGAATAVAWTPSGVQALVSAGNSVEVLGYSAGVLSLAQTLSVSGAGQLFAASTGTDAIVVQPGLNQATTLTAAGATWSLATTVTGLSGAGPLVALSGTKVAIGVTGNVQIVNLAGGVWSLGAMIPLAFTSTSLAVDPQGALYAVGAGSLAVISGTTVTGTGTWSGSASGAFATANQLVVLDPSINAGRVFGSDNGPTWTQRTTVAIPAAFTGAGRAGQTFFIAGSGAAQLYNFAAPYELKAVPVGSAGIYNGTAWTTAVLPVGQVPSAAAFDPAGNLLVSTVQNNLYEMTPGGVLTVSTIAQYAGQTQDVPLGVSSLVVSGALLYAATSMPGVLVQVR